ncbi:MULTISPECIES: YbaB/EbfC family nucleoid-associated protein [Amycolatopsis]|uniref:YbaB/EbfC family nucleoid-associated protein n=1 Tax=Amycolatopsis dendrobii TaxID=2760662 RepID=A0A7W3VXC9_9PSEU|nr:MULTISPECIES: YbaB/EbfC family nucleoid-associated protein [Amycolatopsis]MBB1154998.1 YbaB/EbfC family nucleoid-associated protein [Amycolatopsis dendrobii]UKD56194.1 YbaB/EbfC family nucleoid-associated protein [Amycolatopsis sp. FU40]
MAGPEELIQALSALSVEASSPGNAVTATVNTDGVLTGLKLSGTVRNLPPDELAALVLRTYAEAQRESANRTAALLAPLGTRGFVMDRLKWRAGFEPDLAPATPAPRRPAPPAETVPPAAPSQPKPVAAPEKPAAPRQTAAGSVVQGEGDYLRNRTADPELPAEPERPVSDEDWYEAGVRFDEAW